MPGRRAGTSAHPPYRDAYVCAVSYMRLTPSWVRATAGAREAIGGTAVWGALVSAQAVIAGSATAQARTAGSATGALTSQCPAVVSAVRPAITCCPFAAPP
ncbi:hypothetical protein Aca07nite_67610 [Actinoplanes capillaceus]|uniref:Uncharacterized protein n=1 Tax=Actinoplanes campanulatus TaxID=113559 RepID=A0ABQ3WT67_9ACTN|nr:hypothetical protein Aca07nite_67610 [Actinoplanes capillaceus]